MNQDFKKLDKIEDTGPFGENESEKLTDEDLKFLLSDPKVRMTMEKKILNYYINECNVIIMNLKNLSEKLHNLAVNNTANMLDENVKKIRHMRNTMSEFHTWREMQE